MARDRSSRPEAAAQRLFVAFDLPEGAKDAVARAIEPYRERFPKARWVPRANWHVTLKFLGWTYPRLVGWMEGIVQDVAREAGPVRTHLTTLGVFPSPRRARVIWAGVDDRAGELAQIASSLDHRLSREFKPESRGYTPHLTVARSDPPLAIPEGLSQVVLEGDPFPVEQLILFRSHLRRPAPEYEALANHPLGASR